MSLVTVKPKFQVTIPAKLRDRIDLHEGDLMEATIVEGGILLRPKEVVDRNAVADRIESILRDTKPSPEDAGRSEDEIMEDTVADIAEARKQRRKPDA
ncbi:MAG: AbrB/MazE/SpoVT family DNA-binding domain-containing protein [Rhodospirillales bacterium]|nr:AbrB/MazE/SpoVT family DNA-binding domain-containing protein [Rhodospirillales bacterium]